MDITVQKKSEEDLLRTNILLDSIKTAQEKFIVETEPTEVYNQMLETLLSLTESEYGFIGDVEYDKSGNPLIRARAATNISQNDEIRKFFEENAQRSMVFRKLDSLYGVENLFRK